MVSSRLRVQFEKLFEHYGGENSEVQLDEITEVLFCTRRNARIVLNKLEEEGWIEWRPTPGRGKLSQLIFQRSRGDISESLAKSYLEEGKIEQALGVLGHDTVKLSQVVEGYLGLQQQAGEQVIRLPYYRPLSMLNPLKPMRRSELHIARQIFSGLIRLDENESVQPDLAHAWEAISDCQWRFYIRPGVRFHNGDQLTIQNILDSLSELRKTDLFSHIVKLESPAKWVVDIHLDQPDVQLPLLLTESCAKILPESASRPEEFDRLPIGTGPYRVLQNDNKRLVLQANDNYFGFRPLLDKVEVWVIDKVHSSIIFPSLTKPKKGTMTEGVELDPGCTYLLLNRKNGLAKCEVWASYFLNKLNSLNLFSHISPSQITELGILPAHGVKPGWYHHSQADSGVEPPEVDKIKIAYYSQHPMFPAIAQSIQKILKSDGLTVELIKYDMELPHSEQVDIWIKPMGITTHREDALAGWLLNSSDIKAFSIEKDYQVWRSLIDEWRSGTRKDFPSQMLGKSLVEKKQMIPMFHCWLGVSKDHCGSIQNAKCNALGWFDFSQVWLKPD
ncbi:SgrR family transcriptional regulator [Vibrio sp. S4M6]|uniref:SgrR family transcriptional regulator n=1 Tax=Vibrio sinus TaxID=2946865 RepID=UPI00202A9BD7|nr:SgrR family transcriptional regulator [Vibrio sinus]MCL9783225.1 SgrR family transcriptional regulator [Vibrio sinus]